MNYSAMNVATANRRGDICEINFVDMRGGKQTDMWSTYVNPQAPFDRECTRALGIRASDVDSAPTYPEAHEAMRRRYAGAVIVHHSRLGIHPLDGMQVKYGMEPLPVEWIDGAVVAGEAWENAHSHKVDFLARFLDIDVERRTLGDDSLVIAEIFRAACKKTGTDLEHWLSVLPQPPKGPKRPKTPPPPEADVLMVPSRTLDGDIVVFAGSFDCPRWHLNTLVTLADGEVATSITPMVSMVVTGKIPAKPPASLMKAGLLKAAGMPIRILTYREFLGLLRTGLGKAR